MMTADEYRTKAAEAQDRAALIDDPDLKAMLTDHALQWTQLAFDADTQDSWDPGVAVTP